MASSAEALVEARERFVTVWGGMGSIWGIPRAVAEVHALLYVMGRPLSSDDVRQALSCGRSTASTALRTLAEWGLVHRTVVRGDRKEQFEAEQDVWTMLKTIIRERKKRELDPVLESLQDCRTLTEPRRGGDAPDAAEPLPPAVEQHNQRIDRMLDAFRLLDTIGRRIDGPSDVVLEAILTALLETGESSAEEAR